MKNKARSKSGKSLLVGSNAFKVGELPVEVKERIDEAIKRVMMVIVGEAPDAS